MSSPHVIIIAGPNGAGKTTAAPFLLRDYLGMKEFVNADTIAQGLSAFDPESVAFQAGRVMLRRLDELATERASFAFETTLASRSFAPWIRKLTETGYVFHLSYLWIPTPEAAVARVASRVRLGGHYVPDETVHRRYSRGLQNFFRLYTPIADKWRIIYSSLPVENVVTIAEGSCTSVTKVFDAQLWNSIKREHA